MIYNLVENFFSKIPVIKKQVFGIKLQVVKNQLIWLLLANFYFKIDVI